MATSPSCPPDRSGSCPPGDTIDDMRPEAQSLAPKVRRPRFTRTAPEPIQLTADDLAIIQYVGKHRFLRSTHVARLFPSRSYKKLVERLAALYHNGYLDRPRAQLDVYAVGGSAPMVYGLGNRAAQHLAGYDGRAGADLDWTAKNRDVGRVFIDHTLLVADLMVGAACAVRLKPDVELIDADCMLAVAPESPRRATNPWKFATRVLQAGQQLDLAVIPDAVFGLDFTAERRRKYFFVEADCATMPVVRTGVHQSSFARKLMAYVAGGGKTNAFGQQLGIGNFRVLTVTTSTERIASMIEALKNLTGGAGSAQFLFTNRSTLLATHDLLSLEWISGKGERVRLVD